MIADKNMKTENFSRNNKLSRPLPELNIKIELNKKSKVKSAFREKFGDQHMTLPEISSRQSDFSRCSSQEESKCEIIKVK